MSDEARVRALLVAAPALLELFAVVDAVFTEDDALSPEKRKMSIGRIYEQWKRSRKMIDPEFDPNPTARRRAGASVFHPGDTVGD